MQLLSRSPIAADQAAQASAGTKCVNLLLLTDTSVATAGGSERFLRNLMSLLPVDRYRLTLVELYDPATADQTLVPIFEIGQAAFHRFPVGAVYGARGWRALRALQRLLRHERIDIVQSHHEKSDLLNALLTRRHGRVHISNRRDMGFNKSRRLAKAFRILNHRFDCIAAPAQSILDGLESSEGIDPRKARLIPNGVDVERFKPLAGAQRDAARRVLGCAPDSIVFGCLASLTPVKRHVDLVSAFAKVHADRPQSRLLLIGDGSLRSPIIEQASALGIARAVDLLGDRANVEAILPALDIGLLASSSEGMSNAILEMMACGVPVIATDTGGNSTLVAHGETGLVVPACSPTRLAEAMLELAGSPSLRATMGGNARARVEVDYTLQSMADAFDRLYREMCQPS